MNNRLLPVSCPAHLAGKKKLKLQQFSIENTLATVQVTVVAWFLHVYAEIMHEYERVHYRAYTCTVHATTDLSDSYTCALPKS